MKESNLPRADFVTSIFLTLFGLFILIVSLKMPRFEEHNVNPYSVPGILPAFLGAIITLLGIVLLIRSIRQRGYLLGIGKKEVVVFFSDESSRRIFLTLIISLIYGLVFLGRIPFYLATGIFVFAFVMIFEYRFEESFAGQRKKVLIALVMAVLVSAIVTAVFRYLFLVNLP